MYKIILHIGVPTTSIICLLNLDVGPSIAAWRHVGSTPYNTLVEEAYALQFFSTHRSKGKVSGKNTYQLQLHYKKFFILLRPSTAAVFRAFLFRFFLFAMKKEKRHIKKYVPKQMLDEQWKNCDTE